MNQMDHGGYGEHEDGHGEEESMVMHEGK